MTEHTKGCTPSPSRTYTTYSLLKLTSANGPHSPKRTLKKRLLASEGNLSLTISLGIFASIPSIKGRDKCKGALHSNAVDEVTQMEAAITVAWFTEEHMLSVLRHILATFFNCNINGFDSDNGSVYVYDGLAELLVKTSVDCTKSHSRRSNDNGLVESKNGSIIWEVYGYLHIPQFYVDRFTRLKCGALYCYTIFHCSCYFLTTLTDKNGKQKKVYRYKEMMTPYKDMMTPLTI